MNQFYRDQIERIQDFYKVTVNESGQISIKYESPIEDDGYDINKIMNCLEQNARYYSLIKIILNAIFKKNPIKHEPPCTMAFDWMNKNQLVSISE